MNEKLFQFIWQQLRFNQRNLETVAGEKILILYQGSLNTNQGPDFLNARIRINETTWAGNVELHLRETDWERHKHQQDSNYDNVILHVVLKADGNAIDRNIPTLSLGDRISHTILNKHEMLLATGEELPCRSLLSGVNEDDFLNCNERMLVEKWNAKCLQIFESLKECGNHYEEVLWRLTAGNFGITVNTESFVAIARSLPWKVVQQVRHIPHALESLLLGQGGLLNSSFREKYPLMLKKEYNFICRKYKLEKPQVALHFLRMRPANFPTIRLVQLADLFCRQSHLFAAIRDADSMHNLLALLNAEAVDYWQYHYRLDEECAFSEKKLGQEMRSNILINTFLPFLYAYGRHVQSVDYMNKALDWLRLLPAENNRVTRQFCDAGFVMNNAFDSQAIVYLKKHYCNEKKCLQCSIGTKVLL